MTRTLIVMVKVPRPGRVKTRLGAGIGMTAAAWWFRHQAARLLRRVADPRWQVVLAVSPDGEGMAARCWPVSIRRRPQGRGHLGTRMLRQIAGAAPGPVCLVGADIPGLDRSHIARAFDALRGADAVLGPAEDGGYWLIGMRHPALAGRALRAGALDRVRWSTSHALADTVAGLRPLRVRFADHLADVDTPADLGTRTGQAGGGA
ncbi:TIGR04282 family arsenosugar biosynthesis glycosyltransferase [Chachezhania sediminis]|uniref:TIGR04282 family arsenosugar biosynthesis glycosyltransferase n=1 Tax=Chachezhania sediminis TaxID=2599291 RepID=UPI00131D5C61|nr:TIGR04282 family arsenosugar biosynthesis glycosyltransferase [Chachezhania sediminis]